MRTDDFDYILPDGLIAQSPPEQRGQSRLLVVGEQMGQFEDSNFSRFVDLCNDNDLIVVNDTRVIPARLSAEKTSGGKVEVMLERFISDNRFLALAKSNKPLKPGTLLCILGEPLLRFETKAGGFFEFTTLVEEGLQLFLQQGEVALPPYIRRDVQLDDKQRYQTIYAKQIGAVAAPTAGLHFTEAQFERLRLKGVRTESVTLHVGAGTFQPVRVDDVREHQMHREHVEVNQRVVDAVAQTRQLGGRVIAIGTTTVRALESATTDAAFSAFSGATDIFIYPGFKFNVVDALVTNFHLPKSTLLMMISAFSGKQNIFAAYQHAINQQYRFFSYGDAMFLQKS